MSKNSPSALKRKILIFTMGGVWYRKFGPIVESEEKSEQEIRDDTSMRLLANRRWQFDVAAKNIKRRNDG